MLEDLKNRFDYFVRSKTRFSRRNYQGDKENPEADYVFDILNWCMKPECKSRMSVLDIGSKNWAYVKGEYNFFKKYCNSLKLDGVEIDAYRLYSNLYSRYEAAQFYIKGLEGVSYYPDNLLNIKREYDYIVWLLPFVTKYPLQKWGLPERFFMPERLLEHAYQILGREMLIVNQGEEEAQIQEELLIKLNISYKGLGKIESSRFKNERYGFVITK